MTTTNTPFRVIGVPEHFNLPWYELANQERIEWTDVSQGTGAMLEQLQDGSADMALLLTDGAVAGLAKGMPVDIVGCYVESPLVWGVHVAATSDFQNRRDIRGKRFAISRYGSGSHLMAGVYAQECDWHETPLDYVVVDNLAGARKALPAGDADIFLWEVFTTKPYVDAGEFRRIDEIPTPWPAFVACVHADADEATRQQASQLLQDALQAAANLIALADAPARFADRFGLEVADAETWLARTRWSATGELGSGVIVQTAEALHHTGILDADMLASVGGEVI